MQLVTVETAKLAIGCEISGPESGYPSILLHGWPDDARTWDGVLPVLHSAGLKTIVPSAESQSGRQAYPLGNLAANMWIWR